MNDVDAAEVGSTTPSVETALDIEPIDLPVVGPGDADPVWPWRIPGKLWQHALGLAVLLAVLVPVLYNGAVVSADEGAVLSQVEILSTTGSWGIENPIPEVDPDGKWFGIDISDQAGTTHFPYAKHAVYPLAVKPLYELGGMRAVVAASALGTLVAAVFAALIARRVTGQVGGRSSSGSLDIATLWIVGVISPVFFDSFWVIAHSIGAAFAALAVYSAIRVVEDRRLIFTVVLATAVVGAVLFRSEGMLLGLALGGACGLVALRSLDRRTARSPRAIVTGVDRLAVAAGVIAGGCSAVAWWIDGRIHSEIVGTTIAPFSIRVPEETSWLASRASGIWASMLRPQLLGATAAGTIFLGIALLVVIASLYARFKPTETAIIRGAAILISIGALGALALPKAPVPGLLIAFPLLSVGLLSLRRPQLRSSSAQLIVIMAGAYGLTIVATQYPVGGSMEWGGRFFHLVLPVLVPVLLVSVAAAGRRLDRVTARISLASLATVSVVLVVFAVGTIVRIHSFTADLVDNVVELADSTASADDPGGPVVVSNMEAVGRLAWRQAVQARYLKVTESEDLGVVSERLAAAGVEEFVFAAAYHQTEDRNRLDEYTMVADRTVTVGQWKLYVMRLAGA